MLCSLISNYSWVMACLFGDKEWLRMLHKTFESLGSGEIPAASIQTQPGRRPNQIDLTLLETLYTNGTVCACAWRVYATGSTELIGTDRTRSWSRCPVSRTADTSPEVEQVMVIEGAGAWPHADTTSLWSPTINFVLWLAVTKWLAEGIGRDRDR